MTNRRDFLIRSGAMVAGSLILPSLLANTKKVTNVGVQLYTFRDAMAEDAIGTLKKIAGMGYKEIETARSSKGHYYGLKPAEMKKVCEDLGMVLRSGHVHVDENWAKTIDEAAESGQDYLICSTMPSRGQTVDNYKSVSEVFNKAGEESKKLGINFGYHNHSYEFQSDGDQVLFDVLMDNTEADLLHMELDLGWVIVGGKDPLDYFAKYPGRFPLWHLKDMDMAEKHSTEFGKGGLDIMAMLKHSEASGLKYIFVEQEEYADNPFDSMKENMTFLNKIDY